MLVPCLEWEKKQQSLKISLQMDCIVIQKSIEKNFGLQEEKIGLYIRNVHLQDNMNNNKLGRFNSEFRNRKKVVRGIKKADSLIID